MGHSFQTGDLVVAEYKSGRYIGEVAELRTGKAAVQVLAVVRHPVQGDLHHPMQSNVPYFHQRKALAYREIALMSVDEMQIYSGSVPEYGESLRKAWDEEFQKLKNLEAWAQKGMEQLRQLMPEYEKGIFNP